MEGMEDTTFQAHLTSVAAFVDGGIQDACDDCCSICLEAFCESEPSTVTSCKHEFHLQCVLEWCQRSSQCPMCWQPISLKDPTSQELLEAVEHERSFRLNRSRNATIYHHPTLGDFELHVYISRILVDARHPLFMIIKSNLKPKEPHTHRLLYTQLPAGANEAELEERIIQHLAAASAMGRTRHIARREGQRNRSSAQARPQFFVFSSHPDSPSTGPLSPSLPTQGEGEPAASTISVGTPTSPPRTVGEEPSASITPLSSAQYGQQSASASGSSALLVNDQGNSLNNRSPHRSPHRSPNSEDRAGPSEYQSFSESLKLKFNAATTRYKDSISKSTRGWKERFFSRDTSMSDLGSQVRKEVSAGIATVSRMMERLETRDNRTSTSTVSNSSEDMSNPESNCAVGETPSETSAQASCATNSASK